MPGTGNKFVRVFVPEHITLSPAPIRLSSGLIARVHTHTRTIIIISRRPPVLYTDRRTHTQTYINIHVMSVCIYIITVDRICVRVYIFYRILVARVSGRWPPHKGKRGSRVYVVRVVHFW